jgi:hypothetical protein
MNTKSSDNSKLIQHLHRENRRLKFVLGGAAMAVAVSVCMGAADQPEVLDELHVKRLVVHDESGGKRIILKGDGEEVFAVLGKGEKVLVAIHDSNQIRGLIINANTGGRRAELRISEKSRASTLFMRGQPNRKPMIPCVYQGVDWNR